MERRYPASKARGGGREELPMPEARGNWWEELHHATKPEAKSSGGEEQPHYQGHGRWPGGPTPHPRSHGCAGTVGPRGAIPH